MDVEAKIKLIREWIENGDAPEDWDDTFVESLAEQFEDKGWLSDKQEAALDNIITKWDIME